MRNYRFAFLVFLVLPLTVAPSFASVRQGKHSSVRSSKHRHVKTKKAGAWKRHGQHEIGDDRARDIQEALIAHKYMAGAASGVWDGASKAAMAKFQGDQGWQTKRVPDARALIKLGLGPNHEANPATQVTALPETAAGAPQR